VRYMHCGQRSFAVRDSVTKSHQATNDCACSGAVSLSRLQEDFWAKRKRTPAVRDAATTEATQEKPIRSLSDLNQVFANFWRKRGRI
jgi:hypothetical protein